MIGSGGAASAPNRSISLSRRYFPARPHRFAVGTRTTVQGEIPPEKWEPIRIGSIMRSSFEHPCRGIEPDSLARHARHDERDPPPVRRRPAGVRCPVGQNHVTLAQASLSIGFGAVVADKGLGVGLRQPTGLLAPA